MSRQNEHATFVFAGARIGSPVSNTGIKNAIRAMGDLAPSAKAIRDLYNWKARYLQHRQEMMQWYSDWLDILEKYGEFVEPASFTAAR